MGARQRRRLHALRSHFSSCSATTGAAGGGTTEKQHDNDVQVYTVVLTGGPCGGKTSSQAQLSSTLADAGFDVYFAPEVPSILIRGGAAYPGLAPENSERLLVFEKGIIDLQLQVEESFLAVARSTGRPSVVVLDRGLLDIPAYLPRENWLQMLGKMGGMCRHTAQTRHFFLVERTFTHKQVLTSSSSRALAGTGYTEEQFAARYDLVIHLVSTAHGAESVYEKEFNNNPARTETAQEARELDDKVFACWSIHPNHLRLDNSTSFEAKIAACGDGVLKMIDGG